MSQLVEVKVPDIGDFADVPVIEVFVKAGDTIKVDESIVTLESDKATMDVPSTTAGVVKEVRVKIGDRVGDSRRIDSQTLAGHLGQLVQSRPLVSPAYGQADRIEIEEITKPHCDAFS